MIDSQIHRKIRVSSDGTAGPYIMVPVDQLLQLQEILDGHQIFYWVDSGTISLDGKPAVAFVNLGRSGEAIKVQAILDAAV